MRAIETPFLGGGHFERNRARGFPEVQNIKNVENSDQRAHGDQPCGPAVPKRPPERHADEIPEKQRRIPDRGERTRDIADDENEHHDMKRRDAELVHPDPRADEQHRSTGGADKVCQHRSERQEKNVRQRTGFSLHIDMDAARNHKQRADQADELEVLVRHMSEGIRTLEFVVIIQKNKSAQRDGDLGVMPVPPMRNQQRAQGDAQKQNRKRQNEPWTYVPAHHSARQKNSHKMQGGICSKSGLETRKIRDNPLDEDGTDEQIDFSSVWQMRGQGIDPHPRLSKQRVGQEASAFCFAQTDFRYFNRQQIGLQPTVPNFQKRPSLIADTNKIRTLSGPCDEGDGLIR